MAHKPETGNFSIESHHALTATHVRHVTTLLVLVRTHVFHRNAEPQTRSELEDDFNESGKLQPIIGSVLFRNFSVDNAATLSTVGTSVDCNKVHLIQQNKEQKSQTKNGQRNSSPFAVSYCP